MDGSHGANFIEPLESRRLLSVSQVQDLGVKVPSYDEDSLEINGIDYFRGAAPGTNDFELWRSDGTAPGTYRVKDIFPGSISSNILFFTKCNNTLYFIANDGSGTSLYRSDGTGAGTYALKNFAGGFVEDLTDCGGTLYFNARMANDPYGQELWKTDGTAAGTQRVADLAPGADSTAFLYSFGWNGKVYFGADNDTGIGVELYVTDGTAAGTSLLKDIYPGPSNGFPTEFIPFGNKLYFNANDPTHGEELWETDGTTAGTRLVKDFLAGSKGSYVSPRLVFGNHLYLFTRPTNGLAQMWKMDASENFTMVKQFATNTSAAYSSGATSFVLPFDAQHLFFAAADDTHSIEPWISDGTTAGTYMIKELMPGGGVAGTGIPGVSAAMVDGTAIFPGVDPAHGEELWQSNGTAAGTTLVADLAPGTASSSPTAFLAVGQNAFFVAQPDPASSDVHLYVANVQPDAVSGSISGTVYNDANGNAKRDSGEAGVAGVTVYNDANNNSKLDSGEQTTTTDSSGGYTLGDLAAGPYKIRQILQSGWSQTTPANNYGWTITLATDENQNGKDFGTRESGIIPPPPTGGSIAGVVYNDANGNAKRDSGEVGLSGITIYNDANNNSKLDSGEATTITDANGAYTLSNLASGSYKIREILQSGWKQTTPANNYGWTITLESNQQLSGKDFGTEQTGVTPPPPTGGSIGGTVFDDLDGDGVKDSNEAGVGSITIYNDANNNSKLDTGELTTTTDSSGAYTLANLPAGSYKIREILQSGWSQTTPAKNYGWTITLGTNQQLSGKNFGTKQSGVTPPPGTGSISGFTFNDNNTNGVFDGGDVKTGGKTVFLDTNNNGKLDSGETSIVSDSSGNWSFSGLVAGTYHVRRVFPSGYTYSTTLIDLALNAGDNDTGLIIGSEKIA